MTVEQLCAVFEGDTKLMVTLETEDEIIITFSIFGYETLGTDTLSRTVSAVTINGFHEVTFTVE